MMWWPVVLVLLIAPFATYGYGWLDKQHTLAVHERQITAAAKEAEKARQAAYQLGRRDGTAEVRDSERDEAERTRAALADAEYELEKARAEGAAPPTPAEVVEMCRKSASCRERGTLK